MDNNGKIAALGLGMKTVSATVAAILTDERGRPIAKPRREDFPNDIEFMRAMYRYNDHVNFIATRAFVRACMKAMR